MVYVIIPNGDLDQDSPITQPLMTSIRDNIEAVALQLDDAPVGLVWHPYDMVEVGDGATGDIYNWAVDGTITTVTSPEFEPGYNYMFVGERLSVNFNANVALNIAFYRDTAAAWSGTGSIGNVPAGPSAGTTPDGGTGYFFMRFLDEFVPDVARAAHVLDAAISNAAIAANLTAIGSSKYSIIHGTTSAFETVSRVRFSTQSYSFNSGKIKMFKRKHNRVTGA